MRDAMARAGGDPKRINPLQPVELVIDHSVQIDAFGRADAMRINSEKEFQRNRERYGFLRWGQGAFENFRVVPPSTGIVHQVNLEYLARGVMPGAGDGEWAYPDTVVGTDSHTTMINGLGVLGWGVGGIEAEAAMLGQPVAMLIPDVVGFRLIGRLPEGATATDLVLTVTERLRAHGVVGKFVEFTGSGLDELSLADRATIANMAPEYGATCGIFPVDEETLRYLELSGRPAEQVALVRASHAGAGALPHARHAPGGVHGPPRAGPLDDRALARRPAPAPGPRGALGDEGLVRGHALRLPRQRTRATRRRAVLGRRDRRRRGDGRPDRGRGPDVHGRPRLGGDRVDHELHEHVEPVGHARGGARREEGRREGAPPAALGSRRASRPAPRSSPTT